MTTFVLIHSPLLGPRSWGRVGAELARRGYDVVQADLGAVTRGGDVTWERLVDAALAGIEAGPVADELLLVAHSNAGALLPQLADRCGYAVLGCVFVDAILPEAARATPLAPAGMRASLVQLSENGMLPPWTRWWWEGADVAELFPDPVVRAEVEAEQPRLPLSYFMSEVPVPQSWPAVGSAYLRLSGAYDDEQRRACAMGWPVEHLTGHHLMMLWEPAAVVARITSLAAHLAVRR